MNEVKYVENFEEMTDEGLVEAGVSLGKRLSFVRIAIRNNEMSGAGQSVNTNRQRDIEASWVQTLTEINEHLSKRNLPNEDIANVVATYGRSATKEDSGMARALHGVAMTDIEVPVIWPPRS